MVSNILHATEWCAHSSYFHLKTMRLRVSFSCNPRMQHNLKMFFQFYTNNPGWWSDMFHLFYACFFFRPVHFLLSHPGPAKHNPTIVFGCNFWRYIENFTVRKFYAVDHFFMEYTKYALWITDEAKLMVNSRGVYNWQSIVVRLKFGRKFSKFLLNWGSGLNLIGKPEFLNKNNQMFRFERMIFYKSITDSPRFFFIWLIRSFTTKYFY